MKWVSIIVRLAIQIPHICAHEPHVFQAVLVDFGVPLWHFFTSSSAPSQILASGKIIGRPGKKPNVCFSSHVSCQALAEALKQNSTLTGLNLERNNIGPEGAKAWCLGRTVSWGEWEWRNTLEGSRRRCLIEICDDNWLGALSRRATRFGMHPNHRDVEAEMVYLTGDSPKSFRNWRW